MGTAVKKSVAEKSILENKKCRYFVLDSFPSKNQDFYVFNNKNDSIEKALKEALGRLTDVELGIDDVACVFKYSLCEKIDNIKPAKRTYYFATDESPFSKNFHNHYFFRISDTGETPNKAIKVAKEGGWLEEVKKVYIIKIEFVCKIKIEYKFTKIK